MRWLVDSVITGCPISKFPLCFGCFLGFQSSYRETSDLYSTALEICYMIDTRILEIELEIAEIINPLYELWKPRKQPKQSGNLLLGHPVSLIISYLVFHYPRSSHSLKPKIREKWLHGKCGPKCVFERKLMTTYLVPLSLNLDHMKPLYLLSSIPYPKISM